MRTGGSWRWRWSLPVENSWVRPDLPAETARPAGTAGPAERIDPRRSTALGGRATGGRPDLLDHLSHDAGADRLAALADGEPAPDLEGDRLVQGDLQRRMVAGQDHLHVLGQLEFARDAGRAEEELRLVAAEEG